MKNVVCVIFALVLIAIIIFIKYEFSIKYELSNGWFKYGGGYRIGDYLDFSKEGNMAYNENFDIYFKNDTNKVAQGKVFILVGNDLIIKSPNGDELGTYIKK